MSNGLRPSRKETVIEAAQKHPDSLQHQPLYASQEQLKFDNFLENKLNCSEIETTLTKREKQILEFVLEGHTNREIAKKLYRTERTIEYHRNRMMQKLGVHNPIQLVKRAIAMGIA